MTDRERQIITDALLGLADLLASANGLDADDRAAITQIKKRIEYKWYKNKLRIEPVELSGSDTFPLGSTGGPYTGVLTVTRSYEKKGLVTVLVSVDDLEDNDLADKYLEELGSWLNRIIVVKPTPNSQNLENTNFNNGQG